MKAVSKRLEPNGGASQIVASNTDAVRNPDQQHLRVYDDTGDNVIEKVKIEMVRRFWPRVSGR